ncbi:hypothetical protein COFR110785_00010 [Corynebacterium frankenforstense]
MGKHSIRPDRNNESRRARAAETDPVTSAKDNSSAGGSSALGAGGLFTHSESAQDGVGEPEDATRTDLPAVDADGDTASAGASAADGPAPTGPVADDTVDAGPAKAAERTEAEEDARPTQGWAATSEATEGERDVVKRKESSEGFAAEAVGLVKRFGQGETVVTALGGVDVAFRTGEFTAIMGPSGSGKSTLMHCMAGLDSATEGKAFIGDTDLSTLKDKEMTALRRDRLGFIFQSFNLVPTLTAAENITLPSDIAGRDVDEAWFREITERLGLAERLEHRPAELSGGQQQRVACARALVSRPEIIFGDEPTGNLDSNSSGEVLDILRTAVDKDGQTVVIVTHDPRAASYADRVVFLADGMIVEELRDPTIEQIAATMTGIEG